MLEPCDNCGQRAYVHLRQIIDGEPIGLDLTLCAHDYHRHKPSLDGKFGMVSDRRDELTPVREPEPA